MKLVLLVLCLLAVPAMAEDRQSARDGCQILLQAYGELEVSAKQAKLTSDIQQGIVRLCNDVIAAEEATPQPTPQPTPEEKDVGGK